MWTSLSWYHIVLKMILIIFFNVRNIRKINKDFSCLTFHLGCILFLVTFNVYQYNNVHFAIHLGRVWHLGYILITIIWHVTLVTIWLLYYANFFEVTNVEKKQSHWTTLDFWIKNVAKVNIVLYMARSNN